MVSAIIPTLGKRPDMLHEAVLSIKAQTVPTEIIIVENSDTTYGNQARKINEGVRKSKGKYYFFMGDDDILAPNFSERMLKEFEEAERKNLHWDIVASRFQNFGDDTGTHGPNAFPLCSTVVSRAMYDKTDGYDERAGPGCDAEFYFQCFEKGAQWTIIEDILYFSRVHKDQFSKVADWSKYHPLIKEKYGNKYA